MNKNTIIGFVLIGLILIGFSFYQSHEYNKRLEIKRQADSIANIQKEAQRQRDSIVNATALAKQMQQADAFDFKHNLAVYKNANLDTASKKEATIVHLKNDKVDIAFTTKGAQLYSAQVLDYKTYNKSDLFLFEAGKSNMAIKLYAGESISTDNFIFDIAEQSDTSLVMRLNFAEGAYIQQKYILEKSSYSVKNILSFVGMNKVMPNNVSSFDTDWTMTMPRMEKGYQNEKRYSKIDYLFTSEDSPEEIGEGSDESERIENKLSWFAFQQQFFSLFVRAETDFNSGELSVSYPKEDQADLMTCVAKMRTDFSLSNRVDYKYDLYLGPNHYETLKSYNHNYEKVIPLGGWIVGWFTKWGIIPLFNFLHKYILNFGIIILLMTLIIKIIVLPLAYKSYSSAAKMQILKPEIDKISEKYPKQEDAMKKQQATMALYKRAGVSPLGGCLPMLLQFPILWAMYRFFPASIELRQQNFLWADDLSSYDSILDFGFNLPLLGNHLSLFAVLVAVSMFFYSKLNSTQMSGSDPNATTMRFMSIYLMPIMMFFITNNLSAGLSYYYFLSNIITMIESLIIRKYFVSSDEIFARLKATEGKPIPKSKWQQRLEMAQKMQQQRMKERK